VDCRFLHSRMSRIRISALLNAPVVSKIGITGLTTVPDIVKMLFDMLPPYHLGKLSISCKAFHGYLTDDVKKRSLVLAKFTCLCPHVLRNGAFRLHTPMGKHTVDIRVVRGFTSPVIAVRLDELHRFVGRGQVVIFTEGGLDSGMTLDVFGARNLYLLQAKKVFIREVSMRVFPADTSVKWVDLHIHIETHVNGNFSFVLSAFPDGW
jgi:hypothetical protein